MPRRVGRLGPVPYSPRGRRMASSTGGPILVQKFGGTSLADPARLARSAPTASRQAVGRWKPGGRRGLRHGAGPPIGSLELAASARLATPTRAPWTCLLATGELASTAMMAIALAQRGARSRTPLGGRERRESAPIRTHGRARILAIESHPPCMDLMSDRAWCRSSRVSRVDRSELGESHGRSDGGGSDTTAVALCRRRSAPVRVGRRLRDPHRRRRDPHRRPESHSEGATAVGDRVG